MRLQGRVEVCDGHGGRRQVWSTDGEPDGLLRKACGNRREAVCAPCAERYRGDAWQLIAAGLRGGKGIPESVMGHPAVFATLTAPSFGVVHAHVLGANGEPARCRPRRDRPVCCHGIPVSCSRVHAPDDPCLGEPLCPDCFDYSGAVIWNNLLGELWRRTMIYLPRRLAALVGMTQQRLHEQVRVSYVKVAEYQHRGLVHLHPVIRLDRRMPAYRAEEVRAPARRFTTQLLEDALRASAEEVSVQIPDELGGGTAVRWGAQLDVQQLSTDDEQCRRRASYLAKYTTKSTEQAGGLLHRITRSEVEHVQVREHVRGYLRAAFELHDRVADAIVDGAADDPVVFAPPSRPAPATCCYPNEPVLRVLQAMSTDEWVTIRLHDRTERVGRIARRTANGLILDSGPRSRWPTCARSRLALPNHRRATSAIGGLRHARTPSATAATASPNPGAGRPRSRNCAPRASSTSASSCLRTVIKRSALSPSWPPNSAWRALTSSVTVISQPPTPTSPLKPPAEPANTANSRAKRSSPTTTATGPIDATRRRTRHANRPGIALCSIRIAPAATLPYGRSRLESARIRPADLIATSPTGGGRVKGA